MDPGFAAIMVGFAACLYAGILAIITEVWPAPLDALTFGVIVVALYEVSTSLHEMGHFTAMKLAGVKIGRMALGSDAGVWCEPTDRFGPSWRFVIAVSGVVANAAFVTVVCLLIPDDGVVRHALATTCVWELFWMAANLAPLPGCDGFAALRAVRQIVRPQTSV